MHLVARWPNSEGFYFMTTHCSFCHALYKKSCELSAYWSHHNNNSLFWGEHYLAYCEIFVGVSILLFDMRGMLTWVDSIFYSNHTSNFWGLLFDCWLCLAKWAHNSSLTDVKPKTKENEMRGKISKSQSILSQKDQKACRG